MDLALSDDQAAILDAIDSLARPFTAMPTDFRELVLTSDDLDRQLAEGGFLDVGFDPDLGAVTAALIVEKLARLAYAVEAAASALVRPLLGELPRPICLVEVDRPKRPVCFLKAGGTVVLLGKDGVRSFTASDSDVQAVESLYAYPMAMLRVGSSRVDLQACKLEYSIVSPK